MSETERYLRTLFHQQGITIGDHVNDSFLSFVNKEENISNVKSIRLIQEEMTTHWNVIARRAEINALQIAFPNGTAGKPYQAPFDFKVYGLEDLTSYQLSGFENTGLSYDDRTKIISGTPTNSGELVLSLAYRFEGETSNTPFNQKRLTIIINPDPKSLWKDLPSDVNDSYAKVDQVAEKASFLGYQLIASSKRGRSHANKGSFREDDYRYAELPDGWGLIAISDGAGSAKFARKGSFLACEAVVSYFNTAFINENIGLLEEAIQTYQKDSSIKGKLLDIARPYLSAAARHAHVTIRDFAAGINASTADFHATLAFVLLKRFATGSAFLSFSVGDCPIALVDQAFEWVKPFHPLDTGEYGGGTRFITMKEIFSKDNFEERFNFEFTTGQTHLVLMTDGIYDPKFEVEANLAKPSHWKAFFDDLRGNNGEGIDVLSDHGNLDEKLSEWMDFWSPGNHDDRTLIILS